MPIGIIIVSLSVLFGGLFGVALGKFLPEKMKESLAGAFAIGAFAIALSGIAKLHALPPVVLALLAGTIAGSLLKLERRLGLGGLLVAQRFIKGSHADPAVRKRQLEHLSIAVILFCAGPTGIYGALVSGIAGDHSILISKSFLDFFTAALFAISAGPVIAALSVPMFCVFMIAYWLADVVAPLCTPTMFADFSALGGLLILATAFRMAEIKKFHVTDMLPAMLLVMPCSYLWTLAQS